MEYFEITAPRPSPSEPKEEQVFLLVVGWLVLLLTGWVEARLLCSLAHLPRDCHSIDAWGVYEDVTHLVEKGVVVAWLCHAQQLWSAKRRLLAWYACFLLVGPAFIGLGEVPALKSSLSTYPSGWDAPTVAYTTTFASVLGLVAYQAYRLPRRVAAMYLGSRGAIVAYYGVFGALLARDYHVHVHHLGVGFLIACLARGDRSALSLGFLCVGCGVMVQGIGSYNYAPILDATPSHHL